MLITEINTIEDVRTFIKYLIEELNLNFHPDDPFTDYVTAAGEEVFTEGQSLVLEALLETSFFVCQEVGTDLYELSLVIFLEHHPHLTMVA